MKVLAAARHGSVRRRGVGVPGSSRSTAGGGVVEDAGSAVARPVDAPEPHGPLVLGVVVAPLVSGGSLLAAADRAREKGAAEFIGAC
jgi:hypothetical protein